MAKILEDNNTLWDEQISFYFTETELCFRAKQKDIKLIIKNLPVSHFGKISTDKFKVPLLYRDGRNQFLKAAKEKKFIIS